MDAETVRVKRQAEAPTPAKISCQSVYDEASNYSGWSSQIMQAIARAESGCNQANHNLADKHDGCMGSYGVLQIGCIHYNGENVDDFKINIALAHKVYQSQGYGAWTMYTNGTYKEYLK